MAEVGVSTEYFLGRNGIKIPVLDLPQTAGALSINSFFMEFWALNQPDNCTDPLPDRTEKFFPTSLSNGKQIRLASDAAHPQVIIRSTHTPRAISFDGAATTIVEDYGQIRHEILGSPNNIDRMTMLASYTLNATDRDPIVICPMYNQYPAFKGQQGFRFKLLSNELTGMLPYETIYSIALARYCAASRAVVNYCSGILAGDIGLEDGYATWKKFDPRKKALESTGILE